MGSLSIGRFGGRLSTVIFLLVTYYFVTTLTWYTATAMTLSKTGTYTAVKSGVDPDVQYQLSVSGTSNTLNQFYGTERIQDFANFTMSFEVNIAAAAGADAVYWFCGSTALPTNESTLAGGTAVVLQVYSSSAQLPGRGMYLVRGAASGSIPNNTSTTGGTTAGILGSDKTMTLTTGVWTPVVITYARSATSTWSVSWNGAYPITNSEPAVETWRAASGTYWGVAARCGGATGTFSIRRLQLSTQVSTPEPTIQAYTASGSFTTPGRAWVQYLIVAGGGGGGANAGAGGGAGGFVTGSMSLAAGTYAIVVGAGGAGGTGSTSFTVAGSGSNSSAFGITVVGGGGGTNSGGNGAAGGSGGGGAYDSANATLRVGGAGTAGQGFAGGTGTVSGGVGRTGAGGGGAGGVGQNSQSSSLAGAGGTGAQSSLSGTATYYAGGGGGAPHNGNGGEGGAGGGGRGDNGAGVRAGGAGTVNTGGGGGAGSGGSFAGYAGGSGVVILSVRPINAI